MATMVLLTTFMVAAALAPSDVEADGVRIRVRVRANDYTYEVTNVDAEPIVRFEIEQGGAYLFRAPKGWSFGAEGNLFRAETADPRRGIRRNQTGVFSMRVTSSGALLGEVPARIGLESGKDVALHDVWGIVPEPRGTVALVPLVIGTMVLLHVLLLARRERRAASGASNDG